MGLVKCILILSLVLCLSVSCTTSESDGADGFGDEASETEDMEGAEDATATTAEETDTATEGEAADEPDQAKKEEPKDGDEKSDEDSEDEEFLAEDSASPAAPPKEKLEEKDLQNELEKEQIANSTEPAAPTPEEATPQPVAAGTVTPSEIEDPMIEGDEMAQPNSAAVTSTPATKPDFVSADGFEVINPPVPQEDLGVSDPLVAEVDPPLPSLKAAQEIVPLSKMSKDPFFRNERLMNTVYIVRPNDDLAIISQKIFNDDKTSILFADNPHLSKGIETGDKVYYNSPNRPEDKKAILTFYEDNKMSPQYYVTRKGDDIKKIGREVLGHEEGWKEIWSTNEALQTQAQLPSGLKIRYWSGSEPKAYEEPTVANNESTAAMGTTETQPSPPETLTEMPPPSPEPATIATEDPGMSSAAPIPNESLSAIPSSAELPSVKAPDESSDLMTVAAIAMIAMAGLGIVAIQIKNRKRDDGGMPPSLEFTKV